MFKWLLWPLSLLFQALVALRNALYASGYIKSTSLEGKVISVGNIAVGGTGKSPVVIKIAKHLLEQGARPAILTRGYRSGLAPDEFIVLLDKKVIAGECRAEFCGDEAMMQSHELASVPVVVGANRIAAAEQYLKNYPDQKPSHWILDDGFQHRRINRDSDIVLLDAQSPWADGLMPMGRLREPIDSLKRATAILFTRASEGIPSSEDLRKAKSRSNTVVVASLPFVANELESVDGQVDFDKSLHSPVLMVTGIARPDQFKASLVKIGCQIGGSYITDDHSRFERNQIEKNLARCTAIVTTAKDYWRDPAVFRGFTQPIFILCLNVEIDRQLLDTICMNDK